MLSKEPVLGVHVHPDPSPYPFGPPLVADILIEGLAAHPDRLALVDGERTWSWTELDVAVAEAARGIAPKELVCWDIGNCAEAVIGALATFRAGGIWVGASSTADRARIEAHLGPVRVISDRADNPRGSFVAPAVDPSALAAISFTSGTSGQPKAVMHSQRNLLLPGLISIDMEPPTKDERIGTPLSLGVGNVLVLGPLSALLRGSTYVVMNSTRSGDVARDIAQHRVTRAFVVATMLHDLVSDPNIDPAQLRTIDRIIVGGSPADPSLLASFDERFSVRPTLSYGMSEAPSGVVRESLDDPIGSGRGFPLPHVNVEIVDGEICLRPASTGRWAGCWSPTLGYLGDPEGTAALFANGRMHTGDIGEIDSDGALRVTGRISDVIIRGGANIDPFAIEAELAKLEWVHECVCVGVDDDRLGQLIGVLLVAATNTDTPSIDELRDVLRTVTNHPIDRVEVVDELSRNAMGKIIRAWDPATRP